MNVITKKYYDKLHEKMLANSKEYAAGYEQGCMFRPFMEEKDVEVLEFKRELYAGEDEYSAGIARVHLEVIYQKLCGKMGMVAA